MRIRVPFRATQTWDPRRKLIEQQLSDLHKSPDLTKVMAVHSQILKADLHDDPFLAPKLMIAFSLCRRMELAVNVFNHIEEPGVHMYNNLIRAHAQCNQPSRALSTFLRMQGAGLCADNFTFPFLLKACSGKPSLQIVKMIHTQIEVFGFCSDIFVPNSLIDSYSKCGSLGIDVAKMVFMTMRERDVVSWNSMVCGLAKAGKIAEARQLFDEMPGKNVVSWNMMLDGYVKVGELETAFELFKKMPGRNVVSWSTMVLGFCKAGEMDMARMLFDKMPVKNLLTWTVIISGYANRGNAKEAISLYNCLEEVGLKLDDAACISILAACAESGLLGLGRKVHASIQRTRSQCSIQISNTLIDMYAKCGLLNEAVKVFNGMTDKNVVSWNGMVKGLAIHGSGEKSLELFCRMKQEGFRPDTFTFLGVLCACTHAGFVDVGLQYFHAMETDYGVVPRVEHYGCLIDLLGRGGRLKEALKLVYSMPMEPNAIIWGTLLGACRIHNAVDLAEHALGRLIELNPSDAGNYSLLSNVYAASRDWENVANMRIQMKGQGIQKPSGASYIELGTDVHEFTVSDRSHPKADGIYKMVGILSQELSRFNNALEECY